MKWLLILVIVFLLGCSSVFGPNDGYIEGSVTYYEFGPSVIPVALKQDRIPVGTILSGDKRLDHGWYILTVEGGVTYYVFAVMDENENLKYDYGEKILYWGRMGSPSPVYVPEGETIKIDIF